MPDRFRYNWWQRPEIRIRMRDSNSPPEMLVCLMVLCAGCWLAASLFAILLME